MKIFPLLFLFFVSCAIPQRIYERKELVGWEIRPRPNYKGLTSLRCTKWEKERCIERDVIDFDLTDDAQRLRLHAARFVCRVGEGPHFRICKKLHGLCQQTEVRSGFLGSKREIKMVAFLSIVKDYQYLIDKGTFCISLDSPLAEDAGF